MTAQTIEIFGYAASIFVALSLVMVSIVRLRILNMIGCGFFVVYGALIGAVPIVITNTFIFLINAFYLIQMYRKDISSFVYEGIDGDSPDLQAFIDVKGDDIRKYFPSFHPAQLVVAGKGSGQVYVARKAGRIQGFALAASAETLGKLANLSGDQAFDQAVKQVLDGDLASEASIFVDYIVPKYRDLGLAGHFHQSLKDELKGRFTRLVWINHQGNRGMGKILRETGYEPAFDTDQYQVLSTPI